MANPMRDMFSISNVKPNAPGNHHTYNSYNGPQQRRNKRNHPNKQHRVDGRFNQTLNHSQPYSHATIQNFPRSNRNSQSPAGQCFNKTPQAQIPKKKAGNPAKQSHHPKNQAKKIFNKGKQYYNPARQSHSPISPAISNSPGDQSWGLPRTSHVLEYPCYKQSSPAQPNCQASVTQNCNPAVQGFSNPNSIAKKQQQDVTNSGSKSLKRPNIKTQNIQNNKGKLKHFAGTTQKDFGFTSTQSNPNISFHPTNMQQTPKSNNHQEKKFKPDITLIKVEPPQSEQARQKLPANINSNQDNVPHSSEDPPTTNISGPLPKKRRIQIDQEPSTSMNKVPRRRPSNNLQPQSSLPNVNTSLPTTTIIIDEEKSGQEPSTSMNKVNRRRPSNNMQPQSSLPNGNTSLPTTTIIIDEKSEQEIELEGHLAALQELLKCFKCKNWVTPENVRSCLCSVACVRCASDVRECLDCEVLITHEAKLSLLYHRISSVIPHPCPNEGCFVIVNPRDLHETSCKFRPFKCFICGLFVPKESGWTHFEATHPQQIPLHEGDNENILATQFWYDSKTNNKMICCFVQERFVSVTLYKFEDQQKDAQFLVEKNEEDDDMNVTIKFNFKMDGWDCCRTSYNNKVLKTWIEVPLSVVKPWLFGQCTLKMSVIMKEKKKVSRNSNGAKQV